MNRPFELFRPVLFALGLAAALIAPLLIHGQVHAQATGAHYAGDPDPYRQPAEEDPEG